MFKRSAWHPVSTNVSVRMSFSIVSGNESVFDEAAPSDVTICANGSLDMFRELLVYGPVVPRKDYNLVSGSTIVTLHKDYLKSLAPGQHTISFQYVYDSETECTFTVKVAPKAEPKTEALSDQQAVKSTSDSDETSPKIGDSEQTPIALLTGLMASVAALGVSLRKKRS